MSLRGTTSPSGVHSASLRGPGRRRRGDGGTEGGVYQGPSRLVDGREEWAEPKAGRFRALPRLLRAGLTSDCPGT